MGVLTKTLRFLPGCSGLQFTRRMMRHSPSGGYVGVPAERIVRLDKDNNFWEHGQVPGPCSEIYFDRGEKYGCGSPDCKPGCDCDRYMEIWNNVFTQFYNDGQGNYTELRQKNIDTGLGLERLDCVIQGVDNML